MMRKVEWLVPGLAAMSLFLVGVIGFFNHLTAIRDLAWSPDSTRIAAIDGDSIVEIWEVP